MDGWLLVFEGHKTLTLLGCWLLAVALCWTAELLGYC